MKVHVLLALVLLAAPVLAAPEFQNVIPEDAIGLVLVRNCAELREKFKGYSAYAMWQEPSVQRFVERPLARLNQELQKAEGKTGVTKEQILDLFQGQVGLFVTGTTDDDADAVLMLEIGDRREEALRILDAIIAAAARENPAVQLLTIEEEFEGVRLFKVGGNGAEHKGLTYGVLDDVLLLGSHRGGIKRAVTALHTPPPRPVAASQAYADALERIGSDADIIAFLNLPRLIALIETAQQKKAAPGAAAPQLKPILAALGLDGLISASMGIQLSRDEATSRLFLKVAGEPRGLVRLIIPEPGPLHTGADVPADAASFFAARFEFAKAWDEIIAIMQAVNPMAAQSLQQQQQIIAQTIGEPFSIRDDILTVFGPRVSFYQKFEAPFNPGTSQQMLFALDITGKPAFDAAMDKLRRAVPMAFAAMQPQDYMGHELFVFTPPPNPNAPPPDPAAVSLPAFVATSDRLIISNNSEMLKAHLRILGKNANPLAKQQAFQDGLRRLPVDQRVMISHSDPKAQVKMFLDMLRSEQGTTFLDAMRNDPDADDTISLFDFSLLPPDEDILKHLVPSTSCAVRTPDGILMIASSPANP